MENTSRLVIQLRRGITWFYFIRNLDPQSTKRMQKRMASPRRIISSTTQIMTWGNPWAIPMAEETTGPPPIVVGDPGVQIQIVLFKWWMFMDVSVTGCPWTDSVQIESGRILTFLPVSARFSPFLDVAERHMCSVLSVFGCVWCVFPFPWRVYVCKRNRLDIKGIF